ncbi:MAG TPA: S41 family peptidase [Flavobacteriales bacterium]|nr:S41 family peptidase [Flavobacteriales bacterium]
MSYNQPGNQFNKFNEGNNNRQGVKPSAFFPLLFAAMLAIGVMLGYAINPGSGSSSFDPNDKLNSVISLIRKEYVDKVDAEDLTNKAIEGMLKDLDPHSVYLSPKLVKETNEELAGQFGGVGIQFIIYNDTLSVSHTVKKGPAEKKGIQAFDRILMVGKKKFTGKKITNEQVFEALRGEVGTPVTLKVYRPSTGKTFEAKVVRGVIPVPSVDCAIMLSQNVGMIRISQFGENTFADFLNEARKLKDMGMKKLILDLRDNGGGYLEQAQNIADQFLKDRVKIVYTKGHNQGRQDYLASATGELEDMPLVVLVNHNSASASEIVAGAIQDNDRGAIVGRRTFGKGLVQQQFGPFDDGSALRLTVSRYYTPSGRCIQKPYGNGIDYYHESIDRFENDEFYKPDSSKCVDSLKCLTINKKRKVYGGGGIMPDVFVPLDTSFNTLFYARVSHPEKNIINAFAFQYVERNKSRLSDFKTTTKFNVSFIVDESLWSAFKEYASSKGVKPDNEADEMRAKRWISVLIKAEIGRLTFNNEGYYLIRMINDTEVKRSMNSFWN